MSRIGRLPVNIPKNVKVNIVSEGISFEGPKGKLVLKTPLGISLEQKDNKIIVSRQSNSKQDCANHGTLRALINNSMKGVTEGFKKSLEIRGVGYRAQVQGEKLSLNIGFCHPVEFTIPKGITVKAAKPTDLEIEGIDKALVGEVAASIRKLKPPEPYKGKGIRYVGEFVRKKVGKTVTK